MKLFAFILSLPTFALATRLEACFGGIHEDGAIDSALVNCFDGEHDKIIASGVTDAAGCVSLETSLQETAKVFCVLEDNGQCFATTKTDELAVSADNDATVIDFGSVLVQSDTDSCEESFFTLADPGSSHVRASGRNLQNGCGPASIPGWLRAIATVVSGFRNECNSHDRCYANCWQTRSRCDRSFRDQMNSRCDKVFFAFRSNCRSLAYLFYQAVNHGGAPACRNARRNCSSYVARAMC